VILRIEREKHNVTLEAVTETVDSSKIGQLIEYIYGFAASLEGEKIRERTMRGTRARVFDKKLPITYREPFGYAWDRANKQLVPNGDYDTVKLILNLAIEGKSYDYIIAELKRCEIKSPSGLDEWNKHTISSIIRNPVYAGQYYAFKSEVATPKKRNGNSYGKSSVKRLPQDQWHYIPEIKVVNPPMTLDQRALLLDQLQKRQKLSSRNAKREYLLRGMIFCETHKGKNGEPRIYHGQPHRGGWRYTCPIGGCDSPHLDGEAIEHIVKNDIIGTLFAWRDEEFYTHLTGKENRDKLENELKTELQKSEMELDHVINKVANLEDERISGKFTDNIVYDKLQMKYQARRTQIKEHQDLILTQLAQLGHERQALESWRGIKAKLLGRIRYEPETIIDEQTAGEVVKGKELTFNEWRELLTTLNLEIHVFPYETLHDRNEWYFNLDLARVRADLNIKANPKYLAKYVRQRTVSKSVNVIIKCSLPIKPEYVKQIVSHSPVPG